MTQTELVKSAAGETQCDRILQRLQAAHGAEVSMPELAHAGANSDTGFCMVHSRIADLRKRGHAIPPARTEKRDGQMHSYYKLEVEAV